MSACFLLNQALALAFRGPYQQGDMDVTVQYLMSGLSVGTYRVMLKENFDTACWVPPAGKRASHSFYYGDRMLSRVVDFYCKEHGISVPSDEALKKLIDARNTGLSRAKPPKVNKSQLLEERINWIASSIELDVWDKLVERLAFAVKAYGRHERQHARMTPQNLKTVSAELKLLKIPFKYFNLFEDARIEHVSRYELDEPFGWMAMEDIAPANHPFNMFLRCIQLEGLADTAALEDLSPLPQNPSRTVAHAAATIQVFYRRACECSTADHLYQVISEFLLEFKLELKEQPPKLKPFGLPLPSDDEEEGEPGESGEEGEEGEEGARERAADLSAAAEASEKGDDFFDEFESDATVVGGTDEEGIAAESKAKEAMKGPPKSKAAGGQGIPESVKPTASGGRADESRFLTRYPGAIDKEYQARIDDLTEMLMRMFKTHNVTAYTEAEGRRISTRHMARGELRFMQKKVYGGKGKRKYSIVYDCSGSMSGRPDREGKLLLLALNNIAKKGYLEGHLVLSGWVGNVPSWLQYQFPVKDELILRIDPDHGHEGLQTSLMDNLKHIKGMDDVFVYTDANITDAPLNRDSFARHGVWPVGLYVGSDHAAARMEEHFPQNIIKPTIEEIVEAMLLRNRRTVG